MPRSSWPFTPVFATIAVLVAMGHAPVLAQARGSANSARGDIPARLTDAEFWRIFTSLSEPGGYFSSENLTSNEQSFTSIIPTLLRTARPDGVYLGVGPEQNFTYIANLRPAMAIIVDIRRQNALVHLMYKALFELSPTRADFVARLFGRRLPASVGARSNIDELLAAATIVSPSEWTTTRDTILTILTVGHGFALSDDDRAAIARVYQAFALGGPNISYGYNPASGRPAGPSSGYPSFASIQTTVNEDGAQLTFLASEALYQQVRDLERRNLIVPVVGDFAGPTALRAVGEYLTRLHATVVAFYVSNVEEYLLPGNAIPFASEFYRNLQALPLDPSSMFIRSARPTMTPMVGAFRLGPGQAYASTRFDSAGHRWTRVVANASTGTVTTTTPDSTSGATGLKTMVDSIPYPSTSPLTFSGLASIPATISAFNIAGAITYRDVLTLTRFIPR